MNSKSIIGYILALAGLFGLSTTYEPVATKIPIKLPEILSGNTLLIVSAALILIGIFLIITSKNSLGRTNKNREIPIYKGNRIVGYRRY